jgi:NAD(P)-dependent dehydrogenase (short-subunit alcohol dehydrogenase family)
MPTGSRVWFITGCSSGFGLYLARTALAHGHRVIASSRDPSKTPALVEEVTSKGGLWIPFDVRSKSLREEINEVEEIHGRIDVVVNNAGFSVMGAFEDIR